MTKKREEELVSKLKEWLASRKCRISVTARTDMKLKVCEVTEMSGNRPWNTICYEAVPIRFSDNECWMEILRRRCEGKLLFDEFSRVGFPDAGTIEELDFKLDVLNA